MTLKRRTLLKAGGAALLAAAPLPLLFDRGRREHPRSAKGQALRADPSGILDLPEGFHYRVIERVAAPMSDGFRVPARPDGMACFASTDGNVILMRNHECDRYSGQGAYESNAPAEAYDPKAYGGVTRLVVDAGRLERVSSNLVLTGTMRNCAGGPSPWGWLSCEENVEAGHGYVFLTRTDATQVMKAERIVAYGRFNHEAVCIDPLTQAAYLTEDRSDGCLYRMFPLNPSKPFEGKLQAMRIVGSPRFDCGAYGELGRTLPVEWIDVPDPDPLEDTVRKQSQERGAAVMRRAEGVFFADDVVYVCCTSGGANGTGQIFRLSPERENQPAMLELMAESPSEDVLDCPDNITVAPWGDLYMAEDGSGEQYIRGLTPTGKIFDVARNAKSRGEITGVCFTPDGKSLFMNLQVDGLTIGIQGPFERLSRS